MGGPCSIPPYHKWNGGLAYSHSSHKEQATLPTLQWTETPSFLENSHFVHLLFGVPSIYLQALPRKSQIPTKPPPPQMQSPQLFSDPGEKTKKKTLWGKTIFGGAATKKKKKKRWEKTGATEQVSHFNRPIESVAGTGAPGIRAQRPGVQQRHRLRHEEQLRTGARCGPGPNGAGVGRGNFVGPLITPISQKKKAPETSGLFKMEGYPIQSFIPRGNHYKERAPRERYAVVSSAKLASLGKMSNWTFHSLHLSLHIPIPTLSCPARQGAHTQMPR